MKSILYFLALVISPLSLVLGGVTTPTVKTTSGDLKGSKDNGVFSFKGIPFGQPPVGSLRWEPPKPFTSTTTRNAMTFSPSCIQQFAFALQDVLLPFFNDPPLPESEDCLALNVWTPSLSGHKKPVAFWIHGGAFTFGSSSVSIYDGTSFAKNQDIVVVSINYRTNTFGFPGAEELFPSGENLGLMDQDLALQWVQRNIAVFGGDPNKVTIMGQSAGAQSIAHALQRHSSNPPFRAAILQSPATTPISDFTAFDALSKAINCTQSPGAERLSCMKLVSADVIRAWTNGPQGKGFSSLFVDNATVFSNPVERIRQKKTARVPIMAGVTQDDGSLFTIRQTSLPDFLNTTVGPFVTADQVRAVYPGLNDTQIIPAALRDLIFLCPVELTTSGFVQSGIKNIFRYIYGEGLVFANLQPFPGAGAWHGSEIPEIFGTFNTSTATPPEVTLSETMQTIWGAFIKNPMLPPAINLPRYVPGNGTRTLAKLAYVGNVDPDNVVQQAPSALDDGPCDKIWNRLHSS